MPKLVSWQVSAWFIVGYAPLTIYQVVVISGQVKAVCGYGNEGRAALVEVRRWSAWDCWHLFAVVRLRTPS